MGCVLEQLGEGRRPRHPRMDGQRNTPRGQALFEARERPGIEAELGGDVHGQAGGAADGLLAFQRLPQNVIRNRGVALRMAGDADAPDPGILDHAALEQFDGAGEGRVGDGDVEELRELLALHDVLDEAIQNAVNGLRSPTYDYSWWDIGRRVGMSKQAAQQRWGRKADK